MWFTPAKLARLAFLPLAVAVVSAAQPAAAQDPPSVKSSGVVYEVDPSSGVSVRR
jgi:hypothetical protein